jgi:hypothetical protein
MSLSYLKNNFLVTSNTEPTSVVATSNTLVILLFMNTAHAQYLLSVLVSEVKLKLSNDVATAEGVKSNVHKFVLQPATVLSFK